MPVEAQEEDGMLVIAHRGASGDRPEHTLASYELGVRQGADYIEPDLVVTKDGVLVARHENDISGTTDVDQRPEFASRLTTRVIDGEEVTGWFTEDFTLAELRTLRARERLPELRVSNTAFDGLYQVPTLAEIIRLVRALEAETGRRIGLYPELKHPSYFASIGHNTADLLVTQLHAAGYRSADDLVFIQSFEVGVLERLKGMTDLRLIQLAEPDGGPFDRGELSYAQMLTPDGLNDIARYADGIGVAITLLLDDQGDSTGLTENAHAAGLLVHGWTMRKENHFLPPMARSGSDPAVSGCDAAVLAALHGIGVDGVFSDDPGRAVNWQAVLTGEECRALRSAQAQAQSGAEE
ncbi:glycerophosphodiester phosphodiesterase [Aurantiacibacter sp. MUD11]|nr:glycerophosphodiester phosphodiesterase [Aurantiacibacter sp. MUD11]WAT19327.1 glycerophosphodiester phosphodiesterase [Aurantiacibacter sp. MUD11]